MEGGTSGSSESVAEGVNGLRRETWAEYGTVGGVAGGK